MKRFKLPLRRAPGVAIEHADPGAMTLGELAAVGLYRLDADGKLIQANPRLARLLGFRSVKELIEARRDFRATLYADPDRAQELALRLDRQGSVEDVESELLRADAGRVWVSETVAIVRDDAGRKRGEAGTLVNISARRIAEEAYSRSEEKYRTLVEHSQDGVFVLQDGRYLYVNPAYAHMLGYEAEEMIGEDPARFFVPEERGRIAEIWKERRAGRWESMNYETRLLKKDGKTEVQVSVNAGPIRFLGEYASTGTVRDIGGERQTRRRMEAAEDRYRAIVEHAAVGIYQSSPEGELLSANPALVRMLGYESLEAFKSAVTHLRDLYAVAGQREALLAKLEIEGSLRGEELCMRRRDGSEIWLSETSRVVRDEAGKHVYYEGMLEDVSARKAAEAALRHRASHDPLTGLPNRLLFRERLLAALESARRDNTLRHAVLFADLDAFKRVNDGLGHAQGDRLLIEVASRFQRIVGPNDVVCRHGGDEFAILAEGIARQSDAEALAERIEAAFGEPFQLEGYEIYTQVTIGIVLCRPDSESPEAVLRDADAAMSAGKRLGKASHVLFDNTIRNAARDRLQLEAELRAGLERGEFEPHYQPIYDMAQKRIVAFESLMRWHHPERGLLGPEAFLPLAEETGLILELGWAGLDAALAACADWRAAGGEVAVAVNLSNQQFRAGQLTDRIAGALARSQVPPHLLHLEVTEAVFVDNPVLARRTFDRLHALGVRLHLDDFGTGYSGLSYLSDLPFDALKIDHSFVRQLPHDARARAIVRSIITLARALGLEVIAEGIERSEQAAALTAMDCALVQGYLFGAAVEAQAALALVSTPQEP